MKPGDVVEIYEQFPGPGAPEPPTRSVTVMACASSGQMVLVSGLAKKPTWIALSRIRKGETEKPPRGRRSTS